MDFALKAEGAQSSVQWWWSGDCNVALVFGVQTSAGIGIRAGRRDGKWDFHGANEFIDDGAFSGARRNMQTRYWRMQSWSGMGSGAWLCTVS